MALRKITERHFEAFHSVGATREVERATTTVLPHGTPTARAGWAVFQLAQALAPHARCIWIACGPGNNGGDGLVAARHLHRRAKAAGGHCHLVVTLSAGVTTPFDAAQALHDARSAVGCFAAQPPKTWDLGINALLGIGASRAPKGQLMQWLTLLQKSSSPCLCVDVPSGLDADTGCGPAGQVWFDDLRCAAPTHLLVMAWLAGRDGGATTAVPRAQASHKGSRVDVVVTGRVRPFAQRHGHDGGGGPCSSRCVARRGRPGVGGLVDRRQRWRGWLPARKP